MCLFIAASMCLVALVCLSCDDAANEERIPVPLESPAAIEVVTTPTTVELSWQRVAHAESYAVRLKDSEDSVTEKSVETPRVVFEGLVPRQSYTYSIAALPAEGDTDHVASAYTPWKEFTTPAEEAIPLAMPDGIVVTVSGNEATVVWNPVEGAAGYGIQIRQAESDVDDSRVTDPQVRISDMPTEIIYSVRVRALAPAGGTVLDSSWSSWEEFEAESDVSPSFAGGDGTEADPWRIATFGQLLLFAERVNAQDEAYVGASYALTADIDLTGRAWMPVGTGSGNESLGMPDKNCFRGTFDGRGHRITGLEVAVTASSEAAVAGLFGIVRGATIRDLTLEATVSADCTAPDNYAVAGGFCGVNYGSLFTNCSFIGSVSALSSSDPKVCAYAGGITGMIIHGGTYERCSAEIPDGQLLFARGAVASAGALAATGDSGHANSSTVIVAGDILARIGEAVPADDPIVGVYAGGLIGNSFGVSVQGATVEVSGTIRADGTGCATADAAAGGLEGVNAADVVESCGLTISGTVEARGEGKAYAAGAIAQQANAGYGIALMSVRVATAGVVSAVTTGDAAYTGGMQGNATYQTGGITGRCSTDIAGTLAARAKTYAMCGGVTGQSSEMVCCYALLRNTAVVTVATEGGQGASFGGVNGSATTGNLTSCFAIVDGRVTLSCDGAPASFGGVTGVVAAAMQARAKSLNGCYALVGGTVSTEGTPAATNMGGVVGMMSGRYGKLNGCWWWAEQTPASGVGMGTDTANKFAGRDREGMEAALESLNANAGDYAYIWSESQGCLLINAGSYIFGI